MTLFEILNALNKHLSDILFTNELRCCFIIFSAHKYAYSYTCSVSDIISQHHIFSKMVTAISHGRGWIFNGSYCLIYLFLFLNLFDIFFCHLAVWKFKQICFHNKFVLGVSVIQASHLALLYRCCSSVNQHSFYWSLLTQVTAILHLKLELILL